MTEIQLQSRAFINLWNNRPDLRGRVFAINNNSQNAIKGAMNRAMGVIAGVADMCFLIEGGVIWIEWKTETGKQSPDQKQFEALVRSVGHQYHIVRNEIEFLKIINQKIVILVTRSEIFRIFVEMYLGDHPSLKVFRKVFP